MGARGGRGRVGEPDRALRGGARARSCSGGTRTQPRLAATLHGRDDFPAPVADAVVALAARDAPRYETAIRALVADFEARDEFLEDTPVADTVLALQVLARERGARRRARVAAPPAVSDNPRVLPETRYARSGDVSIAYQVTGDGPFDLVHIPPMASHVELAWQVPGMAAANERLATFSRLIRFDKRGTGMSDPVTGAPTLETRMDDARAVMDAVGSDRAALLGVSEGGPMSILFAATYPDRVWALVIVGSYARILWASDYPTGIPEDRYREVSERNRRERGTPERAARTAAALAPSAGEEDKRALATMLRLSASPGAADALNRMNMEIDVRDVLPAIRVPTLVLNRSGDAARPECPRALACPATMV